MGVGLYFHKFLILALDGGTWLDSRPERFTLLLWVTSVATEQKAAWGSESHLTFGRVNVSLARLDRIGNATIVPLVPIQTTLVGRPCTVLSVVK
jgi:hypothetical protein